MMISEKKMMVFPSQSCLATLCMIALSITRSCAQDGHVSLSLLFIILL